MTLRSCDDDKNMVLYITENLNHSATELRGVYGYMIDITVFLLVLVVFL